MEFLAHLAKGYFHVFSHVHLSILVKVRPKSANADLLKNKRLKIPIKTQISTSNSLQKSVKNSIQNSPSYM